MFLQTRVDFNGKRITNAMGMPGTLNTTLQNCKKDFGDSGMDRVVEGPRLPVFDYNDSLTETIIAWMPTIVHTIC